MKGSCQIRDLYRIQLRFSKPCPSWAEDILSREEDVDDVVFKRSQKRHVAHNSQDYSRSPRRHHSRSRRRYSSDDYEEVSLKYVLLWLSIRWLAAIYGMLLCVFGPLVVYLIVIAKIRFSQLQLYISITDNNFLS